MFLQGRTTQTGSRARRDPHAFDISERGAMQRGTMHSADMFVLNGLAPDQISRRNLLPRRRGCWPGLRNGGRSVEDLR